MIEEQIDNWKKQGVAINTGASENDIKFLEKSTAFRFPDDFTVFYKSVNGFKDMDWTSNMFSIFPLDRIKEEYEHEENQKNFVPVCDFLISSHHLGYLKGKEGIYKDYDQKNPVCSNFTELLNLIEADSEKIY